ncbi:MAG: hypothetical protein ACRERD_30750, partial [Candidatus Binatia bacterium]
MNRWMEHTGHVKRMVVAGLALLLLAEGWGVIGTLEARELLPQKEQQDTEYGETKAPSLDTQKRGIPQALFVWIHMAKGYEVEWDSFGRQGWYTQDPRLKPIAPGTTVFPPDTPSVYVVFEVAPLEDPAQFSAQWYLEDETGKVPEAPMGHDTLEVPGHERYGFLELKKPSSGWPVGNYLLKIFVTPLGQQAFHAVNHVGTMRFQITDQPIVSGA